MNNKMTVWYLQSVRSISKGKIQDQHGGSLVVDLATGTINIEENRIADN